MTPGAPTKQDLKALYDQLGDEAFNDHYEAVVEAAVTRSRYDTENPLGFWDYVRIAFYSKFAPSKLVAVGPARGVLWALPNGKTFFRVSPRLQEVRPLPASGPLPMPRALAMAVIEETAPNIGTGVCTSASFELDEEFERTMQQRDADELAARERARANPNAMEDLKALVSKLEKSLGKEPLRDEFQEAAESLVVARDGVDHITPTEKKE